METLCLHLTMCISQHLEESRGIRTILRIILPTLLHDPIYRVGGSRARRHTVAYLNLLGKR